MFGVLSPRRMANGLDIVSVRIEHEGSIIIRMIVRAYSGPAVVLAAGGDRFFVKSIDGRPVLRRKGNMRPGLRNVPQPDPEESLRADAIARESFVFRIQARDPQRTQCAVIEFLRLLGVADADGDVIQHIEPTASS